MEQACRWEQESINSFLCNNIQKKALPIAMLINREKNDIKNEIVVSDLKVYLYIYGKKQIYTIYP